MVLGGAMAVMQRRARLRCRLSLLLACNARSLRRGGKRCCC